MSLRIPLGTDQTLSVEFHEIERRLRKLEKTTGVTPGGTSTRLLVSGSTQPGAVNLQPIYDRLNNLEDAVAHLPEPITNDFGGVGPSSVHGLVPSPGLAVPPTGIAGHVLLSDGTWGFPFRGLVQVATQTGEAPDDVISVLADLHLQDVSATDAGFRNVSVLGTLPTSDLTLTTHYPSSVTVTTGTLASGVVADVATIGGNNVNVTEVVGVPGFDIIFDWTGVVGTPRGVNVVGNYNGGALHVPEVQLYDYVSSAWVTVETLHDRATACSYTFPSNGRFLSNGAMRVRFYHASSGIGTHAMIIDYLEATTWRA